MDEGTVSVIAIFVLVAVLLWDAYASATSPKETMSQVISNFNQSTGGLLALAIAALWIHWFVPLPAAWHAEEFRNPRL
jgi:hypothetical protein